MSVVMDAIEYQRRVGELTVRLAVADKVVAAARDLFQILTDSDLMGEPGPDDAALAPEGDPHWAPFDASFKRMTEALEQYDDTQKKQSAEHE